jgi:hypothetical protein
MNDTMIKVWRFEDAPKEYQELSTNGGDEDWIAFVPTEMNDDYIPWLESGSSFGCCCVDKYNVLGGTIHIACHA